MSDARTIILSHLRDVADFPTPGIVFKDIAPLLAAPEAMAIALAVGFFLLPILIFMMRDTFDPSAMPDPGAHARLLLHFFPIA